jgi:sigma-B regulation protein RsbU (phosphoserine phosphatase)
MATEQHEWVRPEQVAAPSEVTVVIVDDEPVSRMTMAARLRKMGHRVLEADNGRRGLDLIRRERPHLAVVDWLMPQIDGPTLCQLVRQDRELKSVQVILMTSNDQPAQIAEGLERGADDFLSKAASKEEIFARVLAGLRASALVREIEAATDELSRSNRLLEDKQAELEGELRSAARFVESLLPAEGSPVPGISVAWQFVPSLALGGDLFGISRYGDEDLCLFMLDASGHGVSAALRAASMSTFLRPDTLAQVVGSTEPEAVLTEANRRFPLTPDGDYFTLWYGRLHVSSRRLVFASAGHAGAVVGRQEGSSEWLSAPTFPLGFDLSATFQAQQIELAPHDRLLLMSDGLYEVPSPEGDFWGRTRLLDTIAAGRDLALSTSLRSCIEEARRWHGQPDFSDDVALVGIEIS